MNPAPIVVLGARGQIGSALAARLGAAGIALDRADADLRDPAASLRRLERIEAGHGSIAALINAAAYTAVDRAESEPGLAHQVNGAAPGELARWCAARDIPFVHYSTDYVYPGDGVRPWREDDPPAPLNQYGASKLEGDRAALAAGGRALVFRTSWVYDATGANFLRTMLRLGAERETLRVVADQIGAPTYASEAAELTLRALELAQERRPFPTGVYHLCGGGETSWHGFATKILELARKRGLPLRVRAVEPIATADYPTPARRPANSRLSLRKIHDTFGLSPRHWQAALAECMEEIR